MKDVPRNAQEMAELLMKYLSDPEGAIKELEKLENELREDLKNNLKDNNLCN